MNKKDLDRIRYILSFLKPWMPLYIPGAILVACRSLSQSYLIAWLPGSVIDSVSVGDRSLLIRNIFSFLVLSAVLYLLVSIGSYMMEYSQAKGMGELNKRLFEKVMRLPIRYHQGSHSGDILSRISADSNNVSNVMGSALPYAFKSIITTLGAGMIIYSTSWQVGLTLTGVGLLMVWSNSIFAVPIRNASKKLQEAIGAMNVEFINLLSGARIIKLFNSQNRVFSNFQQKSQTVSEHSDGLLWKTVQKDAATSVPLALHTLVSVIIGLYLVSLGEMSLGGLVIVIRFSSSFMFEMRTIVNTFTKLQEHLASANRVMDIFELPEENYNPALNAQVEIAVESEMHAAECQHVTFNYTEGIAVFKDLCLSINMNKTTALVGKSGSGKSTILKLFMGFYPFEGEMSLVGQTCQSYGLQTLRRLTAYVPQTASLFAGTIYENIAYGRENATYDEVLCAAKQAHAHQFITEMPFGYDTLITERGIQLSGGQRQRICIARAILKDAPIILLDEATSSLDSQSEELIQQSIDDIGTRKTVVIVAHRLSTIVQADKIMVFDQGAIVEQGTHEGLMNSAGAYRELYESQ